ncbi:hypothetical protein VKT23_002724 [Stygiomarasmius scandens]|uniref:Uncharacterized protein n=1 Tax=Marasmiellus scandens TaxID=2682957 RepID=A0ABR1K2V0_9AGAR
MLDLRKKQESAPTQAHEYADAVLDAANAGSDDDWDEMFNMSQTSFAPEPRHSASVEDVTDENEMEEREKERLYMETRRIYKQVYAHKDYRRQEDKIAMDQAHWEQQLPEHVDAYMQYRYMRSVGEACTDAVKSRRSGPGADPRRVEVLERRGVLKEAERIELIKTDPEGSDAKSNCSLDGTNLQLRRMRSRTKSDEENIETS